MNELKPIEHSGQRVITTELLAEVYKTEPNNIKNNFKNHKENFKEGVHYFLLQGEELRQFKSLVNGIDLPIEISKFAPQLYLWTERGANRHCKILDTPKAWEQFDNLEETYFMVKEKRDAALDELSPTLRLLISLELKDKEQDRAIAAISQKVDDIRDVVSLSPNSWRPDARTLIHRIAQKLGGNEYIRDVQAEIFKLVDERAGVSLETRLTFKRRRMADEGACKSSRDKLNKVDMIAADKKLIKIYLAIVKEMAVKYGVASDREAC